MRLLPYTEWMAGEVGIEPTIAVLETAALTTWLHPNTIHFGPEKRKRFILSFDDSMNRLRGVQADMHFGPEDPNDPPTGETTSTGRAVVPPRSLVMGECFTYVFTLKDRGTFRVKIFQRHSECLSHNSWSRNPESNRRHRGCNPRRYHSVIAALTDMSGVTVYYD